MRPRKREAEGSGDLFRARLDQIINMKHELVRLADGIDWDWIDDQVDDCFSAEGRPGTETRFIIGTLLLKQIYGFSDEGVWERWVHDPYFQYFTGETFFQHEIGHERSALSHWRGQLGEKLELLLAESLRVAKRAAIMASHYAHAKQWKRQRRQLKFLCTRQGRLIRDIRRKIEGDETLKKAFVAPLTRAAQVRSRQQRRRRWKLYSLHAPEVECIAKGKAHKPYVFGCKVSTTTTNTLSPGGQFVLYAKALHDRPYDDHTLGTVISETQALTGVEIKWAYVDNGYVGHVAPKPLRVFRFGRKRGVHGQIKRELRRRAAIEPVVGHFKSEGHLGRNYLEGRHCDQANAVLTATGHKLCLFLRWLKKLLRKYIATLIAAISPVSALKSAS